MQFDLTILHNSARDQIYRLTVLFFLSEKFARIFPQIINIHMAPTRIFHT